MRYTGICSIAFHPGSLNVKQKLLSCGHLTLLQNFPVLTAELVGIAGSWPLSRRITVLYVCVCLYCLFECAHVGALVVCVNLAVGKIRMEICVGLLTRWQELIGSK